MDISKALHIDIENIQSESLNDPLPSYKRIGKDDVNTALEIEQLKNEILMLKELVESQKEVIRLMKDQQNKKINKG